jgi:hypothetical protein
MTNPSLQPLHHTSALSQAKLNRYAKLTDESLIKITSARRTRRAESEARWNHY